MIDENFLKAAVRIKKSYLELTTKLTNYEEYVAKTQELVEDALKKVEAIDKDLHDANKRKNMSNVAVLKELDGLLGKLEEDAKRLESVIDPMNNGIERLAVEETELYRRIKEKHPNLTEDQIVHTVSQRLQKEGLL